MTRLLVAIACVVLTVSSASATPQEKFDKMVKKVAPSTDEILATGKFKALCTCNQTGYVGAPGILATWVDGRVRCNLPEFDAAGNIIGGGGCNDWTPLGK